MLKWLKYTLTSFFSNSVSKEGANRSFWNVIFSLIVSIIILTAFIATGFNYSFTTHYAKATDFKEFAYNIFANEVVEERINVLVTDDSSRNETVLKATYNDGSYAIIDTFNEDEGNKYELNNYDLVIDTRPSDSTYFKMDVYYALSTDENVKISAVRYHELDDDSKAQYTIKLDLIKEVVDTANFSYIDNQTDVTLTTEEAYTYIETYTNKLEDDNVFVTSFNKIKELDIASQEYKDSIYDLYVQIYFGLTQAPTLVDYYQDQYASLISLETPETNFIFITDTWASFSFTDDDNHVFTFDGFYTEIEDGFTLYQLQNRNELEDIHLKVDLFVTSVYTTRFSYQTLMTGYNVFSFTPYTIFSLAVFGLLIYCMCKLKKRTYGEKFLGSFKITSSYLIMSSAIAGIIGMILFFFLDPSSAFGITCWSVLSIIGFRTILLVVFEEIAYKKNPLRDNVIKNTNNNRSNIIDIKEEHVELDLSKVETNTKVITNDVDDDEDEKMEFM